MGPVRWTRSPSGSAAVVIDGPVDPVEAVEVCDALRAGLWGARSVVCRGEGLADPDFTTMDLLARLVLFAGQTGTSVRVQAPARLRELIRFSGLEECLAGCWSAVDPGGESEQ